MEKDGRPSNEQDVEEKKCGEKKDDQMNCQNSALEKPRSSLLHDGQTVEGVDNNRRL